MDPLITLDGTDLAALEGERLLLWREEAVFRLEGPGVTECLQGLLTNDVKAGGDHGLVWGAMLTPKGMIISDGWVLRDGATAAWVIVPARAHDTIRTLFQKTLPPRLAKCSDRTGLLSVGWILGATPEAATGETVALPHGVAPFTALLLSEARAETALRLAAIGWRAGPPALAEGSKLLLGWPTLGREIDEKTLVQEVRFDELGGVRYDKGCYTGQETVARLHFRGHPNRRLVGLRWPKGEAPDTATVMSGEKVVGVITTLARCEGALLALAVLRRELESGTTVHIGTSRATVVELPFERSRP